jgi:DNA polymerase
MLFIDMETCNGEGVDLTKVGAYAYASHPATEIICLCYALDDGDVVTWELNHAFPAKIKDYITTGGRVAAHNAQFERLIWQHCMPDDLPRPTFNQWYCTAAQARANGLPGNLDKAAKIVGTQGKDKDGHKLMLKCTKKALRDIGDADFWRIAMYCAQDVVAERELFNTLPPLSDDEQYTYLLNEHMNDRGVQIDREFVEKIQTYLASAAEQLNADMSEATNGVVDKFTQVQRLKDWLNAQGYDVETLDKRHVNLDDFDGKARRAIEIRQLGAKSSASKYHTLDVQASADDRVRGMCQFAGAGQTGRFSSTGAQLHNLPRDVLPDADQRIAAIKRLNAQQYRLIYDEPIIHTASRLLRPTLVAAPGKTFVVGDWTAVEAVSVPWLAGNNSELAIWADPERDPYVEDAAAIGSDNRQVGKVVRLALQFCGAEGALKQMAAQYGLEFTDTFVEEAVFYWREANPWVLAFGNHLERCAKRAVNSPETLVEANDKISYGAQWVNDKLVLRCLLPSGRVISYYDVKVVEGKYGLTLSAVKPRTSQREDLWRGIFVENVAQASCNDLLRFAMAGCAGNNWPLVWHVHDEIVLEMEPRAGLADEVKAMMEIRPKWAADFPLVAEVALHDRYTK